MSIRDTYQSPDRLYRTWELISNLQDEKIGALDDAVDSEDDPDVIASLQEEVDDLAVILGVLWQEWVTWRQEIKGAT